MEAAQKSKSTQHLSKNVLQMKFMQRSVLRIELEQNEEDLQKVVDDEHWVLDLHSNPKKKDMYQKDLGYVFCEELTFGRQSYKGFNPEVEKLMLIHNQEEDLSRSAEKEKQNSVSDQDMTQRYTSLMGILAKKFTKKRDRSQIVTENEETGESVPTKKFMKPADD